MNRASIMTSPAASRPINDVQMLAAVLGRELRVGLRARGEVAQPLVFFLVVASLFPLTVGADPVLLNRIAPGVIWVCALLANLLALPRVFSEDAANGMLEQMVLSTLSLPLLIGAKAAGHWMLSGLLLTVVAPLIALQFGLGPQTTALICLTLLLGTPVLALIGTLAAALTLGTRGGSLLMGLLILPLYVPVLIFGAGAVKAEMTGIDYLGPLYLLAAALLASIVLLPFAAAAAVRISVD